jgi:hypothetical protein
MAPWKNIATGAHEFDNSGLWIRCQLESEAREGTHQRGCLVGGDISSVDDNGFTNRIKLTSTHRLR